MFTVLSQSMNFDITSLAKGTLLGSACLLLHGCTTWTPFKKQQNVEITPNSTLIESKNTKENVEPVSEETYRSEQTTKIEKQHLRALPRRPIIEESVEVEDLDLEEDTDQQHSDEMVMYTVQKGDTLSKIAQKFHVTLNAIMAENHIKNKNRLFPGQVLAIPSNGSVNNDLVSGCYVVQKGDTLSAIAKRFNTTIETLRGNNRLCNDVIYVGQKLRLSTDEAPQQQNHELSKIDTEKYVVQFGDILWNIARRCGMSVKDLMQINHITNPKNLRVGQVLYVKAQPEPVSTPEEKPSEENSNNATPSTVLDNLTQEDLSKTEDITSSNQELEDNFEDLFNEGSDIPLIPMDTVK